MEFYRDDKIAIRNALEEDLDFVLETENFGDNNLYVCQETREEHLKWLNTTKRKLYIIEDLSHKKLGYFILNDLDNENCNISLKRIVISDKGKGYGKRAIKGIKKISFENLSAHRLWLDVRDYNKLAINLYKSVGFKEEGHFIESVYLNGKYVSEYILAIREKDL